MQKQSSGDLLVVILDARVVLLEDKQASFPEIWESLLMLIRAHIACGSNQQTAIFGAGFSKAVLLSGTRCDSIHWEATKRATVELALESASPTVPSDSPPLVAAALSKALCLANRNRCSSPTLKILPRVLVVDASITEVDHMQQSSGLIGCAFAAQAEGVPVDCLSLGPKASSILRQVSIISGGKHWALPRAESMKTPQGDSLSLTEVLGPILLFHFLPGVTVRKDLRAAADLQQLPVVCACHGDIQEIGHVCSCCLAVLCSDQPAICPCCHTRFKRDRDPDRRLRDAGPAELATL
eukprot:TRINITY_DN32450_c0_g2_i1.p1 TRINITY_DN32450_c0_g2~~TRINITY_DN32450_c0_g2_i1.p1  ORF type:complete len:296 (+),score=47.99 TRINITY_DN32450_c0_g2_i1:30-917(+)